MWNTHSRRLVQEGRHHLHVPRKVPTTVPRASRCQRRQFDVREGTSKSLNCHTRRSVRLLGSQEDLIIPGVRQGCFCEPSLFSYPQQHYTFYDFIVNKARGKSGPLFNFDVHDDVRLLADANVEKDESHAGKVVERSWYQRNKHIFPASRWEVRSMHTWAKISSNAMIVRSTTRTRIMGNTRLRRRCSRSYPLQDTLMLSYLVLRRMYVCCFVLCNGIRSRALWVNTAWV